MMPSSPIPDAFWKNMFHVTVALGATATVASLWRQRQDSRADVVAPLKALAKRQATQEELHEALREIKYAVEQQQMSRKGACSLALFANPAPLVTHLELNGDEAQLTTVALLLDIIRKTFAPTAAGRDAFAAVGGCEALLAVLARAHKEGYDSLAKECVMTLGLVTVVDEANVVLPTDVPAGSKGALALAKCPAIVKMLRLLDAGAEVPFVTACLKVFANVATLRLGTAALQQGVDGVSAFTIFLRFLDPTGNQMLSEQAARALQWLVMHSADTPKEAVDAETVVTLIATAGASPTAEVTCSMLELFGSLMIEREVAPFMHAFVAADGFETLVRIWCTNPDTKCRVIAESIVGALVGSPVCGPAISEVVAANQPLLRERRQKDEEERRQQQQRQQQQQRMMMQMMGGGGGGMPPGMMDEM